MAEHAVQYDADAVFGRFHAEGFKILVGAKQWVYVEVIGRVVAVVGVGLKNGVEVEEVHPHLVQVGEFELDAFQVAAEVVLVQVAADLVGLPERLRVLIGLIEPVREGHGLVLHALAEAVREDLVEHLALDGVRRLEAGLVNGQLPAFALLPADHAAVVRPADDAAEIGVEVKVIEVQAHVAQRDVHRKMVLFGRLAVKFHPVMDGHIVLALFLDDEVWVHIAQLFRDAEGPVHRLPGAHGTKGLLEIGVIAVEQTRQGKIDPFSKNAPEPLHSPGR